MIKNNFIITEEEKSHILNLTRLPNFRNPVRLSEQDTGGLKVSWNSEKQKRDADEKSRLGSIETIKKNGAMMGMDFNDTQIVNEHYELVLDSINKYYRSNAFGYFLQALETMVKTFNKTEYSTYIDKLKKAANQIKYELSSDPNYPIENWNSFTNPADKENYDYIDVPRFFGDIPMYTPKRKGYYTSPGKTQGDTEVIDTGIKQELTPQFCNSLLMDYFNDAKRKSWNDPELKEKKFKIALCYNTAGEQIAKKTLLGKTKFKVSGSPYKTLSRKDSERLKQFTQLPDTDKYKIHINDINKNL